MTATLDIMTQQQQPILANVGNDPKIITALVLKNKVLMAKIASSLIAENCFRRKRLNSDSNKYVIMANAGNFSAWSCYMEMQRDGFVNDFVLPALDKYSQEHPNDIQINVTVEAGEIIGWATSCKVDDLTPQALASLDLVRLKNKNPKDGRACHASFVGDVSFLAPLTTKVAISCFRKEAREGNGSYVYIINNMYPGENLGEHRDNITERTGRALFDWGHPGQPLTSVKK